MTTISSAPRRTGTPVTGRKDLIMELFSRSMALLRQAVTDGATPCAAAAVGVRNQLLATAVFGNARTEDTVIPADYATRFDMASLTKILSPTMIALKMLEEGRLTLYDTLGSYFDAPSDKAEITVFQLMTHSSGLLPHIMLQEETSDPAKAASVILSSELVCPPGSQVNYSCMGYILLGKILEQIGGKPLNELAEEYVFDPLGMTHTGYLPQGDHIAATEITPEGQCLQGVVHDENARFLGGISGNAGVFSDLSDCVTFATMLACGGRLNAENYLSPAVYEAAVRNYTPGCNQNRGLGFHLKGEASFHGDLFPAASFGHTGFTGTSLLIDPTTGLYVVLLANRVHPTRQNIRFLRVRRLFHNSVMAEFSSLSSACKQQ